MITTLKKLLKLESIFKIGNPNYSDMGFNLKVRM